jgi:selenocysteine-specific elongation factor
MPLTVGTAGHIDHGKTWLVRALTGKDTDRLPEEKRRGISIELGYAPLDLGDGRVASVVDVPGHERFVRTMVAGATGIDLFLLVIDAAEGARAQTHEHLAILRLLGVERGVVAVTKTDAVDADMLALALAEATELVPNAEVVAVSAKTGDGLDDLRAALARAAEHRRAPDAPTRLYVDRVFTLHGAGTVVTGTLWAGTVAVGETLRVEPSGREVRVRSVQVHDRAVDRAEAGQRVALNLANVERVDLKRGDAIVQPGAYPTSYRLDVSLMPVAEIPRAVTVHHGTAQVPARVVRVGEALAQLRLARPVVAARGDRVVLRAETTVGGGIVLDPAPPRSADADRLAGAERGEAIVREPVRANTLLARGLDLSRHERADGWVFAREWLEELRESLHARIAAADPLDPGVPPPPEPWSAAIVPLLGLERRGAKLYVPGSTAALGERAEAAERLEQDVDAAGLDPIKVEDAALARFLEERGRLVRVGDGFALGRKHYERALTALVGECERAGSITLARFRDVLGISRRPAQLLLERFDADGVTRRVGDGRVLRRRGRKDA